MMIPCVFPYPSHLHFVHGNHQHSSPQHLQKSNSLCLVLHVSTSLRNIEDCLSYCTTPKFLNACVDSFHCPFSCHASLLTRSMLLSAPWHVFFCGSCGEQLHEAVVCYRGLVQMIKDKASHRNIEMYTVYTSFGCDCCILLYDSMIMKGNHTFI